MKTGTLQLRAIGLEDGKQLAKFFNISFPLFLRQSHVLHAPRVFHLLFSMIGPFVSEEVLSNISLF